MQHHTNRTSGWNRLSARGLNELSELFRGGALFGVGRVGGWSTALSGALVAALASGALAGPEGSTVVRGDVKISRSGAETIIQAGRNSIINHRSFNIGANETVRFMQPDASSRVLNRITGASPTRIDGSLIANGRVYLVNPAGVVFSGSARVDVAGLYAAAAHISDSDFVRGINRFTGAQGSVINEGTITANFVGLLGKSVTNGGTINAPEGTVVMASGEDMLIGERTGNIFVKIQGKADDSAGASVTNTGTIDARKGRVSMAAGDVFSMAIRAGGTMKAKTVRAEGQAKGEVRVDGQIDASSSAGKGGDVRILGETVTLAGGGIDASGATGGGKVLVGGEFQGKGVERRAVETQIDAASTIRADATGKGDGGEVVIWSDHKTEFAGAIAARGGARGGDGGNVEVSGKQDLFYAGDVRIGATKGRGGSLLLDPQNIIIATGGAASIGQVSAFGTNGNTDRTVSNATLNGVGGSVTLQANNNITVNEAISLTTSGATLTMQAGNSILLNFGITTNNGAITLVANELVANGVENANRGTGSSVITFASGVTINAGTQNISLTLAQGTGLTNNASGNITLGNLTTTGHALVRNIGPTAASGILRESGSSLVTASSVAFDVSGAGGGGAVGGSGSPMRLAVANAEALGGTGGVFLDNPGAGGVTFGGSTLGGLTGVSAVGAGNVSVASGGATTISEAVGSGSGDVAITSTGALTLNAAVSTDFAAGSDITANAAGISGTGTFAGNSLTLSGTGTFALGNANNVVTLASATTGGLTYNDTNGFSLGGAGVSTGGSAISLSTTAGGLDIAQALNAGAGTVTLNAAGGVSGNAGAITAGTLTFGGGTAYTLTNVLNNVASIGGTTTGAISYADADALTVTALSSTGTNITINAAGLVTITGALNAGAGNVLLTGAGVTESGAGAITSADLSLAGTGTFNLAGANDIDTLTAATTGSITFSDTDGFGLSSTGISSGGSAVSLTAVTGSLTIDQAVNAAAGAVTLTADDLAIAAAVTGNGGITIRNITSGLSVGVGDGAAGTLSVVNAELGFLASTGTVTIGRSDVPTGQITTAGAGIDLSAETYSLTLIGGNASGITVGGLTMPTGTTLTLQSLGTTAINGAISIPGTSTVVLNSAGAVTQSGGGTITARTLTLQGAGSQTLTLGNDVDFLSGTGTGLVSFTDTDTLSVAALSSGGNAITLNTTGLLTLTGAVNAGAGNVSLTAAGVTETGGTVVGAGLTLAGTGTFAMGGANDVATLQAGTTGVVTYNDTNGFTVSGTGINTAGNNATLSTAAGGVAISSAINVGAGTLALNIAGATTQSAAITAASVTLAGAGAYTLTNASNDADFLSGTGTGAVSFTDLDSLSVAGLTSGGNTITLNVTGLLTITGAVNAGAGNLSLTAAGVTETGGTVAGSNLTLAGTGTFAMGGANNVATMQAGVTGPLTYNDTNGFTVSGTGVATGGSNATLSTTAGGMAISSAINVGAGNLTLNVAGSTTQSAAITAAGLELLGGVYTLANAGNAFGTVAANASGALSLNDSDGYTVGTVNSTSGITTSDDAVTLTAVANGLTINQAIAIGNATLLINTPGTVTQGGSGVLTANTLDIRGTANYTLDNNANNVVNLVAGGGSNLVGGTVRYHDADSFDLGAMNVAGGALTLRAGSGTVTQSGVLTSTDLLLTGAGAYTLNAANAITNLAADNTGAVSLTDADGFSVTTVGGINGVTTAGGAAVSLTSSAGTMTISQQVSAGAGAVTLTTDDIAIAAGVTGDGGITVRNVTGGRTIGLAGGAGDLNLTQTELDFLASTGTVTIGRGTVAPSGVLTTGAIDVSGETYSLHLIGDSISLGGATLAATNRLTLQALTGGVTQTGAITADNLRLLGGGTFLLDTTANTIGTLAGLTTGSVEVHATGGLTIGTVGDIGLTTGGNNATSVITGTLTVNQALNAGAGAVQLTQTDAVVSALITGNAGITIQNANAGTIGLGGAAGTLALDATELGLLSSTSTVTIGRSDAFAPTLLSTDATNLAATNYNLHLIADTIAVGGLTLNNSARLTLQTLTGGVTQTGPIIADSLRLMGTGAFTLADATNDVNNLAGAVTGAVTFADADGVAVTTVGDVGLTSGGNAIDLTAPTLITVSQALDAGASTVRLTTNSVDVGAAVTGTTSITIRNATAGTAISLANGGAGLELSQTELNNLSTTGTLTIGRTDVAPGALTTGAVALGGANFDLTLIGDSLALGGVVINNTRTLTLNALTLGATQSGAISAGTLNVLGTGFFDLGTLTNDFTNITGAFTGDLNFSDANTLATTSTGINSGNGNVTLRAPSGLTITAASPLNAGSGIVTLAADAMAIDDNVTGNGGIFAIPFSDAVTIGVGGGAGALNLDATELTRLICNTLVTIGRADAGALNANLVDLTAQGYSLALAGSTVTTNGITVAPGRSVALAADETDPGTNGVVVNGAIVAPAGFTSVTGGGRNLFTANVTTNGSAINITGPAHISGPVAFDTTNAGATTTGANIAFGDLLTGTTADTDTISLNAGSAGDVTLGGGIGSVRFDTFTIVNADEVTLPLTQAAAGGISVTASTITLTGGADTTLGGGITLNGAINATGGTGLDAGTGTIALGSTSSLNINGLTYTLTGNEINLPTTALSVTGSSGSVLTLQPGAAGVAIRIGDAADSGAGVLDLTDSDLASLAASLGLINIGRTDGTHAITILSSTFRSATNIRTPQAGGSIAVNGLLFGESAAADLTLTGSGATTTLSADIVTAGADITISDTVILGASLVNLDTTNAGAVSTGANVGITGTVSATTAGVEGLSIASGTSGVVALGMEVGPSGARLGSFAITSAQSAVLPAINAAAGGISLTGGVFTLSSGASTTAGGSFQVNNTGLLTINTTALSLDGAFTQNALASGNVSLGTDITTTDDAVTFVRPLLLTTGVNINTGAGAGNVGFGSTIDGAFPLSVSAGTGTVAFDGRVGNPTALGALTVSSSGGITVAGGTAPTINAATIDFTSVGPVTLTGAMTSAGVLNVSGGSLTQQGALSGTSVTLASAGSMLINADITTASGQFISLHSGTSGIGDLLFGAAGPTLTADTVTLRAGDGLGGSGTDAIVDALTNTVFFAGVTLGAPSPTNLTIRADGDLSTAANLPAGVNIADQFGLNYTIKSDDGSVTISDATKVNSTNLTLMAATGVNILTAIMPNTLNIMGDASIGGDITTNGDLCFGNAVTLTAPVTLSSGTGTLFIKGAFNSGAFDLTLRGAEIEIDPAGTLTGSASLVLQPDTGAKNVVLGAASSNATSGLDFTSDEIGRINDGYASVVFGRNDGTGILSVDSPVTLMDPTFLRMNGAGGSIAVNSALTGTGNGAFTFTSPLTTFGAGITTAGGAVSVAGPLRLAGVTVATGGGVFSVGGATTLTGDATINTANGVIAFVGPVDGDLTANNRALTLDAGTGSISFNAATGATGRLGALSSTGGGTTVVSVRTAGNQTYTGNVLTAGNLASEGAGDVSITGNLAISGDTVISTAGAVGDDIIIGGASNSVSGEHAFTLSAGSGNVTLSGDAGSGTQFTTFSATGAAIATRSVRTSGNQTFTGPATVTGSIASGGDVAFSGTSDITGDVNGALLTFTGNSTIGGATEGTGNVLFGGTSSVGGSVTSGGTLTFTGDTSLGGNVVSTLAQSYLAGATFGTGVGGVVGVNATTITIAGPVVLERSAVFTGTGDISFAGTILSGVGDVGGNDLTVTTPGITTFGGAVGALAGRELASIATDAAGTTRLNGGTFKSFGPQSYGDVVTLGANTSITSVNDAVTFGTTVNSDGATARSLFVETGSSGVTRFGGNVGGVNPLSSLTTNANGTTFLPSTVRTNGAQNYMDDVRLTADATLDVLVGGGISFGARVDSDGATPRSLTLNSAGNGETRFGGAVGSQDILAFVTTNTDGSVFIGGDILTNGAQTYSETAASLTGDASLSANGILFGGTIVSENTLHDLTLAGGAAGVTVTGDIGVGGNLGSLTAAGTTVSLRSVQTAGDQTYTGNLTIVGNTQGLAFTSNGPAVITGNINGSLINFVQTVTLAGNVSSFTSGDGVTFSNILLLASDSVISAVDGAILFANTVNSSDATGRALTVNNTGTTTFAAAVGTNRTLSNLVTDAGGTTHFNGGNLGLTGSAFFGDAVVLGADTTFQAVALTFGATLDSDGTARNVFVRTASTGNTEFRGNVGSSSPINRMLINEGGTVVTTRSTRIGGNITLASGMVIGDPVVLIGDSVINAGNNPLSSSLFFRSTIDADSSLNNRNLTLLSGAAPTISENTSSTDIVPIGSTRNLTPFRFAGSIGAKSGQRLGSVTLGGNFPGAPPLAATAVFATFDQAGVIPANNAFFNSGTAPTFSINTNVGGFTMGLQQKLTTFGNFLATVQPGGTARLGDLVATADLRILADQIILRTRQAGNLYDDEFKPNAANPTLDSDSGLDFASGGVLAFLNNSGGAPTVTRENGNLVAYFANNSGAIDVQVANGLIFAQFDGGVNAALFNHNTTSFLPLDLKTRRSDANVATSIAGAIPRDRRDREVTEAVVLSSAFGKPLANLNLYIKELDADALSKFLVGRAVYHDVPLILNPTGSDYKVTINRLSTDPVLAVVRAQCDLFYADGEAAYNEILSPGSGPAQADREREIRSAIQESWDNYSDTDGELTGPGFRAWLESRGSEATEPEALALESLKKAKILLDRVDEIGLSPRETDVIRDTVIGKLGGTNIPELRSAILGSPVALK